MADTATHDTVPYNTVPYDTVTHDTVTHGTVPYETATHGAVTHSAISQVAAISAGGMPTVAMPPRRSRWERVQLNARVRVEVEQVLQRFVRDHDTTVQDCVDLALTEFLAARGYPPAVQR